MGSREWIPIREKIPLIGSAIQVITSGIEELLSVLNGC
jgi:hypothetical protein